MNDQPALILFMAAVGLYVLYLWLQDLRSARAGSPSASALPGAVPASPVACVLAAVGAAAIVAGETWGELYLGLSEEQSEMTVFFGAYTLVAAFIEELIFRGYIVIEKRGPVVLWFGIFTASLLFAALHPFLWSWDMGDEPAWKCLLVWRWGEWFTWEFTAKGVYSTVAVFVSSLWFYLVRFASFNKSRSLLPSIVAHATKNLGVFVVKGTQGFIVGWF